MGYRHVYHSIIMFRIFVLLIRNFHFSKMSKNHRIFVVLSIYTHTYRQPYRHTRQYLNIIFQPKKTYPNCFARSINSLVICFVTSYLVVISSSALYWATTAFNTSFVIDGKTRSSKSMPSSVYIRGNSTEVNNKCYSSGNPTD